MNGLPIAFLSMPGGMEWIIVGVLGLLVFGKRLPEVMRGLGGGVREFRKGISGEDEATQQALDNKERTPS